MKRPSKPWGNEIISVNFQPNVHSKFKVHSKWTYTRTLQRRLAAQGWHANSWSVPNFLERIVCGGILEFSNENKLIGDHQFGFQAQLSWELSLLESLTEWHFKLRKNECISCVLIDLTSAFYSASLKFVDWIFCPSCDICHGYEFLAKDRWKLKELSCEPVEIPGSLSILREPQKAKKVW